MYHLLNSYLISLLSENYQGNIISSKFCINILLLDNKGYICFSPAFSLSPSSPQSSPREGVSEWRNVKVWAEGRGRQNQRSDDVQNGTLAPKSWKFKHQKDPIHQYWNVMRLFNILYLIMCICLFACFFAMWFVLLLFKNFFPCFRVTKVFLHFLGLTF